MNRTLRLLTTAAVLALATVSGTNAAPVAGARPDACALITNSEASHILGTQVTSIRGQGLTSCSLSFRFPGKRRVEWLTPNVNPNRPGTLCCSPQGALRRFKAYGATVTMLSGLGRGAFASELKLPNGVIYEQILVARNGWLFVLQGERTGASGPQLAALAYVAYDRLGAAR